MNLVKFKTILKLGIGNLARIFFYKIGMKTGINPAKKLSIELVTGCFFSSYQGALVTLKCNESWINNHSYFGFKSNLSGIPKWHQNCLTDQLAERDKPWFSIGDFSAELGDIKGIWEASRFDWVIGYSQKVKAGDQQALKLLNEWINDWCVDNPPYLGVNWKCGQEASIRIMHLALAALLLEQTTRTSQVLLTLIKAHLQRIGPTVMYAIAQDNNHGTSEAAALFIGGSWLVLNGDTEGNKWQRQGLKWLENRAKNLIENDGGFSQYSVNYHRVMLDTFSFVEVWRKKHGFTVFSEVFYKKLKAACIWLYYFTNKKDGDAPNLGANDGARLIPLTDTDYRNFKPSVQLASILFHNQLAYEGEGSFNLPWQWLALKEPKRMLVSKSARDFNNSGYCYLVNKEVEVFLNYPRFKFRPSQCDALHLDVWLKGINLFRDGGTFSYNAGQKHIDYYGGGLSHNTVAFDEHEQMPRISRFLLGNWLKTNFKKPLSIKKDEQCFAVGYKDRFACQHNRFIQLTRSRLIVKDHVSGFKNKAVLRYRLAPSNWKLLNNVLTSKLCSIVFSSDVDIKRLELLTGFESRYYYKETKIPVVELEIHNAGIMIMEVQL